MRSVFHRWLLASEPPPLSFPSWLGDVPAVWWRSHLHQPVSNVSTVEKSAVTFVLWGRSVCERLTTSDEAAPGSAECQRSPVRSFTCYHLHQRWQSGDHFPRSRRLSLNDVFSSTYHTFYSSWNTSLCSSFPSSLFSYKLFFTFIFLSFLMLPTRNSFTKILGKFLKKTGLLTKEEPEKTDGFMTDCKTTGIMNMTMFVAWLRTTASFVALLILVIIWMVLVYNMRCAL